MKAEQAGAGEIVNALTIDVEEHFQMPAFAAVIPRAAWDSSPCRADVNVDRVLSMLAEHDVRATFFTLGWIAERFPDSVRRIVAAGHELASLGYERVHAFEQGYGALLADMRLAKAVLEDISGVRVNGYRAPGFSIVAANDWAYYCIAEVGHRYSSSTYPIDRDRQPIAYLERFAYEARPGLIEVPVATVRAFGSNWPAGGGEAFRLLPYPISRWLIRRVNIADHRPATFHFDLWELDPAVPDLIRQYRNAGLVRRVDPARMESRLRQLLSGFRWDRVDNVFLAADGVPLTNGFGPPIPRVADAM